MAWRGFRFALVLSLSPTRCVSDPSDKNVKIDVEGSSSIPDETLQIFEKMGINPIETLQKFDALLDDGEDIKGKLPEYPAVKKMANYEEFQAFLFQVARDGFLDQEPNEWTKGQARLAEIVFEATNPSMQWKHASFHLKKVVRFFQCKETDCAEQLEDTKEFATYSWWWLLRASDGLESENKFPWELKEVHPSSVYERFLMVLRADVGRLEDDLQDLKESENQDSETKNEIRDLESELHVKKELLRAYEAQDVQGQGDAQVLHILVMVVARKEHEGLRDHEVSKAQNNAGGRDGSNSGSRFGKGWYIGALVCLALFCLLLMVGMCILVRRQRIVRDRDAELTETRWGPEEGISVPENKCEARLGSVLEFPGIRAQGN